MGATILLRKVLKSSPWARHYFVAASTAIPKNESKSPRSQTERWGTRKTTSGVMYRGGSILGEMLARNWTRRARHHPARAVHPPFAIRIERAEEVPSQVHNLELKWR
jgi:hypothetical protein